MIALWALAVIGVVAGDVGLGYHYKVPQTSYGIPTYQTSSSSGVYNTGLSGSSSGSNYNGQYTGAANAGSNYYTGQGANQNVQSSTIGYNTKYQTGYQPNIQTTGGAIGTGSNSNYYQTSSSGVVRPTYQTGGDYSAFNQFQTSSQYQTSAANKYQQYYNVVQQQPAQVFKHYYVHAAPEEPEISKPRQPIVLPPAQKHYKVIFIKAPAAPAQAPQIIPVQPQNEEKTIVYVLVKKPEEAQDIVIPKIEQKPPTKPEVYFIKYNNKQDSQAVINNIVGDLSKGGSDAGYAALSDEAGAVSGINQGVLSTSQVGQDFSQNQGSSSVFDSSSLGSTVFGSGSSGSGASSSFVSIPSTVATFADTGSTASTGAFGSGLTGGANYGSSFGSSLGSTFGSSNNFGSIYEGAKGEGLSAASVDTGASQSGYDSSSGSSGYETSSDSSAYDSLSGSNASSTASTLINYDANAISTSQGVPHETYGPPKFKTL
uniref:Cuticular protein PxutCPT1 n=1 Tax=Papilio xuthus TaxID=66420 RepID=I4DIF1_PAPXU|nr:uncharacterized LOC106126390 precursor [Papilio xuthus]BAM17691.1 cuticular protein PxutCPT1 [Papilio xuthus]